MENEILTGICSKNYLWRISTQLFGTVKYITSSSDDNGDIILYGINKNSCFEDIWH